MTLHSVWKDGFCTLRIDWASVTTLLIQEQSLMTKPNKTDLQRDRQRCTTHAPWLIYAPDVTGSNLGSNLGLNPGSDLAGYPLQFKIHPPRVTSAGKGYPCVWWGGATPYVLGGGLIPMSGEGSTL